MSPLGPSVIWMVNPATVRIPTRDVELGFVATKKSAVPVPVVALPEVTEIQLTLLAAVHEQDAVVTTLTVPSNPPAADVMFPNVRL